MKHGRHLRTFHDIQAWRPVLEEATMSVFGADRLFKEVFSVINCHVAPVDLLDLAASDGTLCCTGTMVGRCFTTWQALSVSGGSVIVW